MALYFAYGSNLSSARVRQADRAPSARLVGAASLSSHTLTWCKRGADGSGKCTLARTESRADGVWGVLWEIDDADVARLDAIEGAGYERVEVTITTGNQKMSAFTYLARSTHVDPALRPASWYRDLVIAGAREHGLPAAWIRRLESQPVDHAPEPSPGG